MAISDEIQRLQSAKAALKTAINAKNDSSHQIDDETLEDYAGFVNNISTGSSATLVTKSITANGTYNASNDNADGYSEVTVNVPALKANEKDVCFYDYDGTILYSYTASEFANLTAMPANPSHSGLISLGWNYTLADAKSQASSIGFCDIGLMYVTSDGKTRLYCYFSDKRLSPYLGICPNGTVVIDWGDNSLTSTLTGTSTLTLKTVLHTYAAPGYYVISLEVTSGKFSFSGTTNSSYILTKGGTDTAYVNRVYAGAIYKIELGSNATLGGNYSLCYCIDLLYITIPSNMTGYGTYTFLYCYNLRHINIASSTTMKNYMFRYCYALLSISIPYNVSSIAQACFTSCLALKRVAIKSSIATISSSSFLNCYSLHRFKVPTSLTKVNSGTFLNCAALSRLDFPSTVTEVQANAFSSCYGMAEFHFASTTVPTLAATSAFSNIPSDCKIYVPSAKLTDYQSAQNWNTYSSYMVGE